MDQSMKTGLTSGEVTADSAVKKTAYQDGAWFYDEYTGEVIARYDALVKGDYDTQGACVARCQFIAEHGDTYTF